MRTTPDFGEAYRFPDTGSCLECRLLMIKASRASAWMTEDAVVNEVVDSSDVRYAVIAGLRTETGPERLVIAYPNEKLLRDLIAGPSIIAGGFSSREEAVAGSRASLPTAISYQRMLEAVAGERTERYQQQLNWTKLRGEIGSTLRRFARFLATSHSHVSPRIISIFLSTNTVS